jgi:predicted TIM-barrel fold metal-dependent hydrolase
MLIVHGQIHLWEKGTPSPPHRQEPYSAERAIAAMDQAGVDRALIHPVLWDPDSNELAVEAVRKYPNRFAIMGWFYLDEAEPDGPAEQRVELQPLHQLRSRAHQVERLQQVAQSSISGAIDGAPARNKAPQNPATATPAQRRSATR